MGSGVSSYDSDDDDESTSDEIIDSGSSEAEDDLDIESGGGKISNAVSDNGPQIHVDRQYDGHDGQCQSVTTSQPSVTHDIHSLSLPNSLYPDIIFWDSMKINRIWEPEANLVTATFIILKLLEIYPSNTTCNIQRIQLFLLKKAHQKR